MKKYLSLLTALTISFLFVGCGGTTVEIDPAALESAFASGAPDSVKPDVDAAVAAMKAGDLSTARSHLAKVVEQTNDLTQSQLDAAGKAFTDVNVALFEKGDAESKAEAEAKSDELQQQAESAEPK